MSVERCPRVSGRLVVEDLGDFTIAGAHMLIGRETGTAGDTPPLALPDTTRTLSKVHGGPDRVDDEWVITDLNSAKGVAIVATSGAKHVLDAGEAADARLGIGSWSFVPLSPAASIHFDGRST